MEVFLPSGCTKLDACTIFARELVGVSESTFQVSNGGRYGPSVAKSDANPGIEVRLEATFDPRVAQLFSQANYLQQNNSYKV
jgi:hypothetical protein